LEVLLFKIAYPQRASFALLPIAAEMPIPALQPEFQNENAQYKFEIRAIFRHFATDDDRWPPNCNDRCMNNTTAGILILTGVAGGAIYYAKTRSRQKSILARTRKQAGIVADKALKLSDSAAGLLDRSRAEVGRQTKGVVEAIGAGKAAYLRVAG
jgi:hypothetical protein